MRPWALGLALLWEKLRGRARPRPPIALVREALETLTPLDLEATYRPLRRGQGVVLVPWDGYMEEAERVLRASSGQDRA